MNNLGEKQFDVPNALPIEKIKDEANNIKTFTFRHQLNSKPGQFVMMWIPRINEKPFSISYDDGRIFELTIAKVGYFTEELFKKKQGERVGIRGPYGSYFKLEPKMQTIALVGGGYGAAPLATIAEEAVNNSIKVFFINGARTKEKLLFRTRLEKIKAEIFYTTDDGSFGEKGLAIDALTKVIAGNPFDAVFCCGPEMMEKAVYELCLKHKVPCQISVERYMKCGHGVCGQCAVDDTGERMCVEGPILSDERLKNISEFGQYYRKKSGKKEMF